MCVPKEKHVILFDSLHSEINVLANTLFPNSLFSVAILPLTYIDTHKKQITQHWLHEKERLTLNGFSFAKRHREWLGGRICSKKSLHTFSQKQDRALRIPKQQEYHIASEESGRPYFSGLEGIGYPVPELSISHSKDFATALTSNTYCGIDIQYPAGNLQKVSEQFSSNAEKLLLQNKLPGLSSLQQLTLLWAGKEAVKKMLSPKGIPGFNEITLQSISPHDQSCTILVFSKIGEEQLLVAAGILDNGYGLALCCENRHP